MRIFHIQRLLARQWIHIWRQSTSLFAHGTQTLFLQPLVSGISLLRLVA